MIFQTPPTYLVQNMLISGPAASSSATTVSISVLLCAVWAHSSSLASTTPPPTFIERGQGSRRSQVRVVFKRKVEYDAGSSHVL